jgi:transcriptional regulator with XRE-family HTH domain
MQIRPPTLHQLAQRLQQERQRQNLSREQLAAVCNVSPSFIRDAERDPGRCSFEKLLQLIQGLGLEMAVNGWQNGASDGPDTAPNASTGEAPKA